MSSYLVTVSLCSGPNLSFSMQLLLFLLCHSSWNVRRSAYNSVTKIFHTTSQLATTLLDDFSGFLSQIEEKIVSSRTRYK